MSVGSLGSALDTQADLAKTLFGGKMAEMDQAMKTAKVGMQMQVKAQEMGTAQQAVAMMTGVGTKLNTVA